MEASVEPTQDPWRAWRDLDDEAGLDTSRHRLVFTDELDRLPREVGLWSLGDDEAHEADDEAHARLREAVERALTEAQREAVELFFFHGLSQGEVARQLGVTQQVIQKRIYGVSRGGRHIGGALARLRAYLRPTLHSANLVLDAGGPRERPRGVQSR